MTTHITLTADTLDDLKSAVAEEVAIRAAMWVAMAALVWRVM